MSTITVGDAGQRYAERFLKQKGYKFIERNWRARFGEIDIIYQKPVPGGFIKSLFNRGPRDWVFVEVKTLVNGSTAFQPENHLNTIKQEKLRRLATAYLHYKHRPDAGYQIDLVAVDLDEKLELVNIRHYENVIENNF